MKQIKLNCMKWVKKILLVFVLVVTSFLSSKAKISSTHYLPPLKTAVGANMLGQRIYLSTPETIPFDVNVYQGTSTTPISTISISNSQPGMFVPPGGGGINNSSIVSQANAGIVLSVAGFRFDAPSGKGFYVNWRAAEGNQGSSLVSLGKAALGTNFKWGGVPQVSTTGANSVIGIMATEDNTVVKISGYNPGCTFSKTIGGIFNTSGITDDSLTINLNAGQTYTLECVNSTPDNLSGWLGANISSNKNIAVNQGHLWFFANGGGADYSMTQLAPITNIGKEYLLIRGNGIDKDEYPLLIATKDNTSIYLNNEITPFATINNGQWVKIPSNKYSRSSSPPSYTDGNFAGANMYIRATENIYTFQAICGNTSGATIDLFQVAPLSCFLDYGVNNIPDILKTANGNILLSSIGLTLTASAAITTNNISIQYDSTSIRKTISTARLNDARRTVLGTTDWVSYYIPSITPSSAGNLSIVTNGPVAIGYLGVSGVIGVGGYFSGFGSIPTISTTPQNICLNASATALTSSIINATYTYQWYVNNTQVNTGGTIIAGATASTYTPSTTLSGTKYYYVTVTNQVGCAVNSNASGAITVNQNSITLSSSANTNAQNLCKNNPIANITYATIGATNATVAGLPTGVTGAWLNNVLTISGTPTVAGTFTYTVSTMGGCSTATASGTITVTTAGVSITSSAGNAGICAGTLVTFTSSICGGTASTTYQWFKNGTAITGANSATYSTNTLNNGDQIYVQIASRVSNSISQSNLILNLDAGNKNSYNTSRIITSAKVYSVFAGGLRSANYTVQYSDDNSSWTTAFTGVMSNNSSCGIQTGSGVGSNTVGAHRYWRYVEGTAVASHHPRSSRIILIDSEGTEHTIARYADDNCSDNGDYIIGTVSYDFTSMWNDLSSNYNNMNFFTDAGYSVNTNPIFSTDGGGSLILNNAWGKTIANTNISGAGPRTISAWVNLDDIGASPQMNIAWIGTYTTGHAFEMMQYYNRKVLLHYANGSNGGNADVSPSQWNYLTVSNNGSTSKIYINGILDASFPGTVLSTDNTPLYIGSTLGWGSLKGKMASLDLYNIALTDQGVLDNYNATKARFDVSTPIVSNTLTTNIIGSSTISLTSAAGTNSQTVCLNDVIVPVTFSATGATSATVTGLPSGVTGSWASNVVTISGTPTVSGNYTYTVNFVSTGCAANSITGTIKILAGSTPVYSVTLSGEPCIGKAIITATTGFNSYTWQKDNATISGAISNTYTPINTGLYKVIVSNGVCASTSSVTAIFDCGLNAEGKMVPSNVTTLVSKDGSTNNGTGLQEVGKILSISNTYSVNIIEAPVNGGRLLLNLDAKNYNSLAHTANPATWKDLTINHNDAPIFGSPVYVTTNGGGLNFVGGNANYVQAANATYFNNNSFTIQAWVYPTTNSDWSPIIDFGNGENTNNIILSHTYGTSGKPGLNIEGSLLQANATMSLNAWHFICASFDVSNNTATLYIDGQPSGTATMNVPTNIVRTKCYIGKSNMISVPKPNYIGGIGAIQIYQGYLNAAEILSNYNNTKSLYGL